MSSIVWLASYPKSGSTWIRVLLANYVRAADAPVDINALEDVLCLAGARELFDEWVGVEASTLPPALIDRLRADVYRRLAGRARRPLFVKVHDAWTLPGGEPMFPADVTAGVVYIVRNPLDVAVSCAHHWGIGADHAVARMCDPSYAMERSLTQLDSQLRQFLGSWSGHARSWLDDSGLPCHLVRYEDLRSDPERAFGRVVRFCGLEYDRTRVRRAVAFSDFTELRRQERANGFRERSPSARGDFFRRGQVGTWHDELPDELARQLVETQRETISRFGYLDDEFVEVQSGSARAGHSQ